MRRLRTTSCVICQRFKKITLYLHSDNSNNHHFMKKFQITLMALAVAAAPGLCRQLSPTEALSAALGTGGEAPAMFKASAASGIKLAYTVDADNFNSCYIFNRGTDNGFLVVAADDAVTPLLGYSERGSFDPENIPANMKAFLDGYTAEIRWASTHPDRIRSRKASPERAVVSPICTTTWSQSEPYNLDCPIMGGYRAVTGCVATAMAQIMKAHNWPKKGVGSNSYTVKYDGTNYDVSSDFSAHTYDWDNMADAYPSSTSGTAAQRAAVAQLMYDCGVSVNMAYSPYASGADGTMASLALVNNFNYDKGMRQLFRDNYYLNEWNDLAYAEVAAGRPTLVCGSNSEGGHAFVCDGYSSDDYFHINWGWNGMSDGYFLLSVLDPEQQGIGGSSDGYSNGQRMTIGIQPSTGTSEVVVNLYNSYGFTTDSKEYDRTSNVTFSSGFYNMTLSSENLKGTLGVKLADAATGAATYISQDGINFDAAIQYGFRNYTVPGSKFPTSGRYIVTPAFKTTDGKWVDVRPNVLLSTPLYCDATDTKLTFSNPEAGKVEITEFELLSETYIGYPIAYKWKLVNTTPEMAGTISTALCAKSSGGYRTVAKGEESKYDLLKGETIEETWTTLFDGNLTARQYYLTFFLGDNVISSFPITMKANPGELAFGTPSIVSLNPDGEVALNRRSRAAQIDPNFDLKATVKLSSGYFGDTVTLDIYHNSGRKVASSEPVFLTGAIGDSPAFTVNHSIFADMEPDVLHYALIQPANGKSIPETVSINQPIWFKLTEASGVEDVTVDSDNAPAEYFDLQGRKVDSPATGLYIVRRGDKVAKEYVK